MRVLMEVINCAQFLSSGWYQTLVQAKSRRLMNKITKSHEAAEGALRPPRLNVHSPVGEALRRLLHGTLRRWVSTLVVSRLLRLNTSTERNVETVKWDFNIKLLLRVSRQSN
ncbi:hypothetical protein O181_015227 [Austropuccinia psidii MF-1]|uniref:Uncharacterized protein n=1 Tax=Austropuccinia psidii MF-1 TaxID=1389203 RepID=A0A9Q3GQK8_9BASI|nr:hypothetical protein [Austropuccinia psidii MF-1]